MMIKKRFLPLFLSAMLLCGCTAPAAPTESATIPAETHCVYDPQKIVAWTESATLTAEALQIWYQAEAAQFPQETSIDQLLGQALTRWHTVQALLYKADHDPLPLEEDYDPDRAYHEKWVSDKPAAQYLYGEFETYRPNTQHQQWLDSLLELVEGLSYSGNREALLTMAQDLNRAYMYFTELTYDLEISEDELLQYRSSNPARYGDTTPLATLRHILITGESCEETAVELLTQWEKSRDPSEAAFAQLASQHSQDALTASGGGLYQQVTQAQLPPNLGLWSFDPERQPGDTAIIPSEEGLHIVYYCSREETGLLKARQELLTEKQSHILAKARAEYPMKTDPDAISLQPITDTVSLDQLLYPDIAHQRYPEVPVYLQQDYPRTMYGQYKITTNGCGITSLAMLASYMTDDQLTPPELCARYGKFSTSVGTDGSLFEKAPAQLGFYLKEKIYDWRIAREYMKEGCLVVVVQHKGYWTRGGHYLVLEALTEDGMVRVRDSNIYNYAKLERHKDDCFPWDTINGAGMAFWIFPPKQTTTAACTRCGNGEIENYLCEKCETALTRRNTFLSIL